MKILFIGTVKYSFFALKNIIDLGENIVGVITSEDNKLNSDFLNLVPLCKKNNIPFLLEKDVNSKSSLKWIKSISPDVIFCFGWSRLLKKDILNFPKLGVIGYHPSLLPENRGRHPLIWALALGLNETGSTFFIMDEGADTGDIVNQKKVKISAHDNAYTLYEKMIKISKSQIKEIINKLKKEKLNKLVQKEMSSNNWRKRTKIDGQIDWRMSASNIHNLVRALYRPYPGAHFLYEDKEYKVWKTKVLASNKYKNFEPGKIINDKSRFPIVVCGQDAIKLVQIEPKINLSKQEYL
jgi:methionyl-tRNA formyltransferase